MEQETVLDKEREPAASKGAVRTEVHRAAPPEPKTGSRKFVIFGALAVLAAVGIYLWVSSMNRVSTDDAQVDGHIIPVSSKIYGKISEVLVNDNQQVKKGDVLARIDPSDYQVKVDQAQAAIAVASSQAQGADVGVPLVRETTSSDTSIAEAQQASAQADYEKSKTEYDRAAGADISWARANVEAAKATAERAQEDLKRMKALVDKEEISRLEYDGYAAQARVADSQLMAAQERLAGANQDAATKKAAMLAAEARVTQARAAIAQARANEKQVNVRVADAASAAANVQQAKANLEAAQLNVSYTTIVAPMDGVVTKKSVEVGQIVQQGQGLLMLVPLNDVWVTANFKETQLAEVRPGQKAEVKADLSGKTYSGHVDSIAAATGTRMSLLPPENATGNYVKVVQRIPVKIVIDPIAGGNQLLRPGMNVEATVFTK